MKDIVNQINNCNVNDLIDEFDKNNNITLLDGDFVLLNDDFEIIENPIVEYSLSGDNNIKSSVNCFLTDDLIKEGIVRDMVRKVQNLRKESDFQVSDRINVIINCNNVIFDSINQHLDYFKNETLCIDINRTDVIDFDCNTTFKLNSENIELGIKKL